MLLRIPFNLLWTLAGLIFLTTFVLPTAIILLMLRFKMISSLSMPLRSERIGPLIVTAVFFLYDLLFAQTTANCANHLFVHARCYFARNYFCRRYALVENQFAQHSSWCVGRGFCWIGATFTC